MRKFYISLLAVLALSACSSDASNDGSDDSGICGKILCGENWIDPMTDNNFCGAKDTCEAENAGKVCGEGQQCVKGACSIQCGENWIDPMTDVNFCGAKDTCEGENAGVVCAEGLSCVEGACKLVCPEGQVKCGDVCIDPLTDNNFCGAKDTCEAENVGVVCAEGTTCIEGICTPGCTDTQLLCNNICIDPKTDVRFCGAKDTCEGENAGVVCAEGESCVDGACKLVCLEGQIKCGENCIDPLTDNNFCGAKDTCDAENVGVVCAEGTACVNGTCTTVCTDTQLLCDNVCVDFKTDVNNCGACGNVCASGACVDGACTCTGNSECGESSLCIDSTCEACHVGDVTVDSVCPDYACIIGEVSFSSTSVDGGIFGCDSLKMLQGDIIGPTDKSYTSISFPNLESVDGDIIFSGTSATSYVFEKLKEVTGEIKFENLNIDTLSLPELTTVGALSLSGNTFKDNTTQTFPKLSVIEDHFTMINNTGVTGMKFGALTAVNIFIMKDNSLMQLWLTGLAPNFQYVDISNSLNTSSFFWNSDMSGKYVNIADSVPCSVLCSMGFQNVESFTCGGKTNVCKK